jgi:hypothetical protein
MSESSAADDLPSEKGSIFCLPRLYGGGSRKSSSIRPSTPSLSPNSAMNARDAGANGRDKDPAVPRKRTSPGANSDLAKAANGMMISPLKPGRSILEQIGEPDHAGWMRKKGDHYSSWKSRYFVLKGPHLYCLKSNSKTVCGFSQTWVGM